MELKPGYKLTEVGVIPEDWPVVLLDSVAKRGSGHTPDKAHPEYWNGNIKWVSLQDSDRLDRLYIFDTAAKITPDGIANSSAKMHPAGTVVLSRDAGVGKSSIMAIDMAVSQHFIAWTCGTSLDNHFLYYLLQENKSEFERIAMGSTIKTIGLPFFRQLQIPLPARAEQEGIAEALSDADVLIESLEHLLVKKRQIKQGAMQELLTGKKRLPGFTGKWKSKLFGAIAQPRKQRIDPRRTASNEFSIELEHIEQVTGSLGGYTATGEGSSLKSVFQKDDVLFGKLRAYLRKYWLADREGVCSTEIWVLMANSASLVPPYLFQIVRTDRFIEAASTAYGTHMPRSDWNVVKNLELQVPPPEEQMAIADILSDMDTEIISLETKLAKARRLKQGMMQELLTGRIRLVRPSAQVLSFPVKEKASVAKVVHNTQINEAVVIAVLSAKFGSDKFPLGRFRRTKFSYLLHRHVEHEAVGFMKKAAGPYNPRTRYGGAEKIALQNRYVRVLSTGKSEGFLADENIAQAEGYFDKWYGAEALTWLEQFRYQKNDALELLTTVDMACEDLSRVGKAATLSAVKQIIHDSPEWNAKLNRAVFSDDNIATTIQSCGQLFPVEDE
jgi:type I restriction enzyme S subunit